MKNEKKNGLVWISIKVTPQFKESVKEKSIKEDPLGMGNLSNTVRKAIQSYLTGDFIGNEDLKFLYRLMEDKFTLKVALTDNEKQRLMRMDGDING
ncbi:hypothetical protein LCGC14_0371970 [marine sediment metagenome]|uniref:Uncharacterized protein n=1 Tax=marine sediment metagenome TaxID=412755 RepID=A0A0F9T574_9ZZZZ